MRREATAALSALLALIGVALLVQGALGRGVAAFVFGALFVAAGLGRLYLSRR